MYKVQELLCAACSVVSYLRPKTCARLNVYALLLVGEGGQLNCWGWQPGCGGGLSEPPHELELTTVPMVKAAIFSNACLLPIFSRSAYIYNPCGCLPLLFTITHTWNKSSIHFLSSIRLLTSGPVSKPDNFVLCKLPYLKDRPYEANNKLDFNLW